MPPKKPTKITVVERTVTTKEVRKEYASKPPPKKSGACFRCGRTSHWASDCYARTDVNGDELESDEEDD